MLESKFSHVDLAVSSLARSLAFYRGLLGPLGWDDEGEIVDERAAWASEQGATVESGPRECDYTPGYHALFLYDPDGIKVESLHRPGREA
jgi:catechol 2,3-dioxygenase-like lactoylglutathione lyase family enzyme